MPVFKNFSKHPLKINQAKIVDMFVRHVVPGAVATNPIKTWYFNINVAFIAIGSGNGRQEFDGIRHMFKDVT